MVTSTAKWNYTARNANGNGARLIRFTEAKGAIVIGPEESTHLLLNFGRPQLLDIAILKDIA